MSMRFRRRDGPRLTPEEAARQGRAAKLAIESFAEPAEAVAFLNAFDERMGGRPIDLAVASAGGLSIVEQALAGRAPVSPGALAVPGSAPVARTADL